MHIYASPSHAACLAAPSLPLQVNRDLGGTDESSSYLHPLDKHERLYVFVSDTKRVYGCVVARPIDRAYSITSFAPSASSPSSPKPSASSSSPIPTTPQGALAPAPSRPAAPSTPTTPVTHSSRLVCTPSAQILPLTPATPSTPAPASALATSDKAQKAVIGIDKIWVHQKVLSGLSVCVAGVRRGSMQVRIMIYYGEADGVVVKNRPASHLLIELASRMSSLPYTQAASQQHQTSSIASLQFRRRGIASKLLQAVRSSSFEIVVQKGCACERSALWVWGGLEGRAACSVEQGPPKMVTHSFCIIMWAGLPLSTVTWCPNER